MLSVYLAVSPVSIEQSAVLKMALCCSELKEAVPFVPKFIGIEDLALREQQVDSNLYAMCIMARKCLLVYPLIVYESLPFVF